MSNPFLGEIRIMSFNFPPQGWALCNGQFLPINQNQALFSILGTTYGGNGQTTFALPDLRGRVPLHFGNGFTLGERAGQEAHTITQSEMPTHTHLGQAKGDSASLDSPIGNFWANGAQQAYRSTPDGTMNPTAVSTVGGSQAHTNLSPFLTLSFCIALQGIFPSQN